VAVKATGRCCAAGFTPQKQAWRTYVITLEEIGRSLPECLPEIARRFLIPNARDPGRGREGCPLEWLRVA
jgi:hypothetical protein